MNADNGLETLLATIVFLRDNKRTLMLHRNKNQQDFLYDKFVPPGGKKKKDESVEHCAIREYYEETGLEISKLSYRGRVLFDNLRRRFNGKPSKYNYLVYIFETHSYSGKMKEPKEGILVWTENNHLKDLNVEKGDVYIFKWLEQGIKMNHKIILSENEAEIEELKEEDNYPVLN